MIHRLPILAALCATLFAIQAAVAGDVRFPATGNPAFSFRMPDDWTTEQDGPDSLLLVSGDHSTSFSLTLDTSDDPLDDDILDEIARVALKVAKTDPAKSKKPASISGFPGFSYTTTTTNKAGILIGLTLILVRIDATHLASCTKIEAANNSPGQRKAADAVLRSMMLSPPR